MNSNPLNGTFEPRHHGVHQHLADEKAKKEKSYKTEVSIQNLSVRPIQMSRKAAEAKRYCTFHLEDLSFQEGQYFMKLLIDIEIFRYEKRSILLRGPKLVQSRSVTLNCKYREALVSTEIQRK